MSLEILSSRTDEDGLQILLERAIEDAAREVADSSQAGGKRFVILVPARLRPYVERGVLDYVQHHRAGRLQPGATVEVHSFSSFARSVIGGSDGGQYERPVLSSFALRAFLCSRMVHDKKEFRQSGEVFGSADQFAQQISELLAAGVSSSQLRETGEKHNDRLTALAKLTQQVEQRFGDKYVMPNASAQMAIPWLKEHGNSLWVYCCGFERFTAGEGRVIGAMAEHAHAVMLANAQCAPDFIDVLEGRVPSDSLPEVAKLPDGARPTVMSAADEVEEIRYVSNRIKELGKTVPYSQILVTARDLSPYRALLETEFTYCDIPLNATPAATMIDHPLADVVLGLLDGRFYGFDPACVMRVLRSGLLRGEMKISRSALDRIAIRLVQGDPNHVWQSDSKFLYDEQVQHIRAFVNDARDNYQPKDSQSVREALTGMVDFLVKYKVNQAWLHNLAEDATDEDLASEDRRRFAFGQTRQVWNVIMGAFEEMVSLFGDERFADFAPAFVRNLEKLLASQPLGVKPKAMNAVDVVAFPTAMRPYRYVFILGASESQLPAVPHESGLLDDSERVLLADYLDANREPLKAESIRSLCVTRKSRREILALNRVLCHAGNVTVICPRNSGGNAQGLSLLAERWLDEPREEERPLSAIERCPSVSDAANTSHDIVHDSFSDDRLDENLARELFTYLEGDGQSQLEVFNVSVSSMECYYKNHFEYFLQYGLKLKPVKPFGLDPMIEGSFYHAVLERVVDVRIAGAEQLPSDYLHEDGSSKTDHELVDLFSRLDYRPAPLKHGKLPNKTLLEEDASFAVLVSSNRMRAVYEQLVGRLHRFLECLEKTKTYWRSEFTYGKKPKGSKAKNAPKSSSSPLCAEQQFGGFRGGDQKADGVRNGQSVWPALEHDITVGDTGRPVRVRIRGKVDRLEKVAYNNENGVLVLDYKSTPRVIFGSALRKGALDKDGGSKVYYGHELQLLTYARAVEQSESARAVEQSGNAQVPIAGAFFLPIKFKGYPTDVKFDNLAKQEFGQTERSVRLFGFSAAGEDGVDLVVSPRKLSLDTAGFCVDPWQGIGNDKLDEEAFEALLNFTQRKIRLAARAILQGELTVSPYRSGTDESDEGTKFSDFTHIMALDLINGRAWRYEKPLPLEGLLNAAQ